MLEHFTQKKTIIPEPGLIAAGTGEGARNAPAHCRVPAADPLVAALSGLLWLRSSLPPPNRTRLVQG